MQILFQKPQQERKEYKPRQDQRPKPETHQPFKEALAGQQVSAQKAPQPASRPAQTKQPQKPASLDALKNKKAGPTENKSALKDALAGVLAEQKKVDEKQPEVKQPQPAPVKVQPKPRPASPVQPAVPPQRPPQPQPQPQQPQTQRPAQPQMPPAQQQAPAAPVEPQQNQAQVPLNQTAEPAQKEVPEDVLKKVLE
ncbi:hypothetical protein ACFL0K_03375 [Patescibacteria group bacterium]